MVETILEVKPVFFVAADLMPKLAGEIFLAGENLTNVSFAYMKDYPMPGINGMAGVGLKF
jgi:hypothetical protein